MMYAMLGFNVKMLHVIVFMSDQKTDTVNMKCVVLQKKHDMEFKEMGEEMFASQPLFSRTINLNTLC